MTLYRVLLILFISCDFLFSQNKIENYITNYKQLAIDEMNRYSIPASITLAQGILESGSGQSKLAKDAFNHFGIKCHKNSFLFLKIDLTFHLTHDNELQKVF